MALMFGVGVGLIILTVMWAVSLGVCIIASKYQSLSHLGTVAFIVAAFITVFLFCVPRDPLDFDKKADLEIYDILLTWRIVLIILLSISFIVGFILVLPHLFEPVYAKRVKAAEKWTVVSD